MAGVAACLRYIHAFNPQQRYLGYNSQLSASVAMNFFSWPLI